MPAPRPKRRILWISIITIAALSLATFATLSARIPRDHITTIRPGQFLLADDLPGRVDAGSLTVEISREEGRLEIFKDGTSVWSSPTGHPFLGAGSGPFEAREDRGYFWVHTSFEHEWGTQVIESVEATANAVTLHGILQDDQTPGPTWTATFSPSPRGVTLEAEVNAGSPTPTAITLWSGRSEHAAVHGFGEQFTDGDLDGKLLPILVREQGVGRGEQPITFLADITNNGAGGTDSMTYATWLSWVTGDVTGVRFDPELPESHAPAVADLRTPGVVGVDIHATHLRAELTAASTPMELLQTQFSGAQRPHLAPWAHSGAILGLQGGSDEVRRNLASLQDAGAAIAGVWLQDWTGQRTTSFGDRLWWTWQLDHERYPDWPDLVAELADAGLTVTTYVNPFLVDPAGKTPAPDRNLFAEAAAAGYLVLDPAGAPYALDQGGFDAYLVDLTNPDARAWFSRVIAEEVLAHGVRGFMADFAEGLPFDAILADADPFLAHNAWPGLWAKTVAEACEIASQPDCVRWFRTGSLGMEEYTPLFWAGDQLVTFSSEDGLASVLRGTFSAGISGWALTHSDIGGYTSINAVVKNYVRTPELLARWAEFAAFGPVMRTHEGNRPSENLHVFSTAQTRGDFARGTQIFAALGEYRAQVITHATDTGIPAIRPMWLMFPGTAAAQAQEQFLFGDSVLVAPVLSEAASEVTVVFPPGRWQHLLTGQVYDGDRAATVSAPIGEPAAFVEISDPWAPTLIEAFSPLTD